jgi:hypothetical protein
MGSGGGLVRTSGGGGPPPLASIPTQPPGQGQGLLPIPNMQIPPPINQPPPMFGVHMPPPELQQVGNLTYLFLAFISVTDC